MTSVVWGSWVEINPKKAKDMGLKEGDVVWVESQFGKIKAPVYIYPAIMPDVIAMPIGQGHSSYGRYARERGVNPIQILAPKTDLRTGALAWAATRVKIRKTGENIKVVKTEGTSRELGRGIVQTVSTKELKKGHKVVEH
jgi:molybdopterin-containing oxidoreductase family iron-sulfur binding subunit